MIDEKYLIQSYENAAGALKNYEHQYEKDDEIEANSSLLRAAASLCESVGRMNDDDEFWENLARLMADAKRNRTEIEPHLKDIERFMQLERRVFENAGLCRSRVAQLIEDTELALKEIKRTGWPDDLPFVRKQLNRMSVSMCNLSRGNAEGGWFGGAFFQVRKGLRVVGGGVTVATNVVSIPTLGVLAYLSGVIGASMIADSFDSPPKRLRRS